MHKRLIFLFSALLILSLFSSAPASESSVFLLYQKNGIGGDVLGYSVAGAGDINGDGKHDFIVGALTASPGGLHYAGSVFVYSGANGSLLFQKDGLGTSEHLGHSVAGTGDVNGDGNDDFIVSAVGPSPRAGTVFVYSGADGSLLFQKNGTAPDDQLGTSVAGAGDVNGDGKADFIASARLADAGGIPDVGSVFVYSGEDGSLLLQKSGAANQDNFGRCVAGAGDLNQDGKADFIVGANYSAFVYSGADGSLLFEKNGSVEFDNFGASVAGAGDVNGDGTADFIIGAPGSPYTNNDTGSVFVYSGADGSLLFQKDGTPGTFLGSTVAGAGDVDGDGRDDFIVGAPLADPNGLSNAGSALVYSGVDGSLLLQVNGTVPEGRLGYSVAAAGLVNFDEKSDVIVGAPFSEPEAPDDYDAGSVFVFGISSPPKGDLNADGNLTLSDLVLMLNCIFLGTGNCYLSVADLNCDGAFSPADVVFELNAIFLGSPITCP